MASPLQIKVEVKPALSALADTYGFTPQQVQAIGVSAGNRALASGKTSIVRDVAGTINLLQKDIRDLVKVSGFTRAKLEGRIDISRKPIPLINFVRGSVDRANKRAGKNGGVTVEIFKGKTETLRGAFIATMASGHTGIFERRHVAGRNVYTGPRNPRLPIDERFGLTLVGYIANADGFIEKQEARIQDVFATRVQSGVQRMLARQKPE